MMKKRFFLACAMLFLCMAARAEKLSIQGLQIQIGNSVQDVQKALHTAVEPEAIFPSQALSAMKMPPMVRQQIPELDATQIRLKTTGVSVTFDRSGIAQRIRLEAPFAGSIGGIKIGNAYGDIIKLLGKPALELKDANTKIEGPTPIQYDVDENTMVRFDFDASGDVTTMHLIKVRLQVPTSLSSLAAIHDAIRNSPAPPPASGAPVAHTDAKTDRVSTYQIAAEQGDTNAQFKLSLAYQNGTGVPRDNVKAVYWLQKAADQGFANAEINLGAAYLGGKGVAQDFTRALYWYQKAANQGSAIAEFSLGVAYCYGNGGTLDYTKAVYWFRKAAEQGHALSASKLGYAYEHGLGVQQDSVKGSYWYKRGATPGQLGPGEE